jgi:hypothetical protein
LKQSAAAVVFSAVFFTGPAHWGGRQFRKEIGWIVLSLSDRNEVFDDEVDFAYFEAGRLQGEVQFGF